MRRGVSMSRIARVLDEANAIADRWDRPRDLGHVGAQEAADRRRAKRLLDWVARELPTAVLEPQVVCAGCSKLDDLRCTAVDDGRVLGFCSAACRAFYLRNQGGMAA